MLAGVLLMWVLVDQDVLLGLRLRSVEATYGSVDARYNARAVLIRQERIVTSPATGRVTLLVNEGRHVRTGDAVLEVDDEGTAETIAAELGRLGERERALEAAYQADRQAVDQRIAQVKEQIDRAEDKLALALSQGEAEQATEASALREELNRQLRALQGELEALARAKEQSLGKLEEERRALRAVRPVDVSIMKAPASGIVSFQLDGLEGRLSTDIPIVEVLQSKGREARIQDGTSVALGDALFRVVDPAAAIHVALEVRGVVPLTVGEQVFVAFNHIPERSFPGRLVEAVQLDRTWHGLVALTSMDSSLVLQREANATLLARRAEGIVVPRSALVDRNGELGVYVLLGKDPVFRKVRVLGGNDERVAIDSSQGVPVGAPVVRNPGLLR